MNSLTSSTTLAVLLCTRLIFVMCGEGLASAIIVLHGLNIEVNLLLWQKNEIVPCDNS